MVARPLPTKGWRCLAAVFCGNSLCITRGGVARSRRTPERGRQRFSSTSSGGTVRPLPQRKRSRNIAPVTGTESSNSASSGGGSDTPRFRPGGLGHYLPARNAPSCDRCIIPDELASRPAREAAEGRRQLLGSVATADPVGLGHLRELEAATVGVSGAAFSTPIPPIESWRRVASRRPGIWREPASQTRGRQWGQRSWSVDNAVGVEHRRLGRGAPTRHRRPANPWRQDRPVRGRFAPPHSRSTRMASCCGNRVRICFTPTRARLRVRDARATV
jgi:hypothetical protein